MAKAKQIVKGKIIKKDWFPIQSSKEFDSTFLGEAYVIGPELLMGRHLTVNLANLTGDIRQQGINLKFKVNLVEDGAGVAEIIGYEASSSQLRRLVRRGIDRMDDSLECVTSQGQRIRVKPFAVTKTATSKGKLSLIRALLRKAIVEEAAKNNFDGLVKLVISNQFQTSLKSVAKKVFPLKSLEIRRMDIVGVGEKPAQAPVAESVEVAPQAQVPEEAVQEEAKEAPAEEKPKHSKPKKKEAEAAESEVTA